jgi:ornithine cyclodeaminase/alanine dehydrogenase-like protein (mu-crystallin family)
MIPGRFAGQGLMGIKVVTVFHGNRARGEESHCGSVLLFEDDLGQPVAVVDAAAITAIRTAAASAVATRALARPDACDLALLGSGVQASYHLAALRCVRPIKRVRVWSQTAERARDFAARESERYGIQVETMRSARETVDGADLICTVTSAREPILSGPWIDAGAHLNVVGSCSPITREVDGATIARSRVFVDSRESANAEAGDILLAQAEGSAPEEVIEAELGEVLLGEWGGARRPVDITLFKSLGLAIEDLATAGHVYRAALREGVGTRLEQGTPQ